MDDNAFGLSTIDYSVVPAVVVDVLTFSCIECEIGAESALVHPMADEGTYVPHSVVEVV